MMTRAANTMTSDVIAVPPELPLVTAWDLMKRWRFRHLPVVAERRVVGILTDRDLLRGAADDGDDVVIGDGLVGEAMSVASITCRRDTSVSWLATAMIEHKIDGVPVVDAEGRLVGLVTSTDLLKLLIDHDEAKLLPFDFNLRIAGQDGVLAAA